jgi:hypothetical protein
METKLGHGEKPCLHEAQRRGCATQEIYAALFQAFGKMGWLQPEKKVQ